jgi:hypothetical protein
MILIRVSEGRVGPGLADRTRYKMQAIGGRHSLAVPNVAAALHLFGFTQRPWSAARKRQP